MKAISLYEPWATLVILGEKEFETRGFSVKHRGPLLIQASKNATDLKEVFRGRNLYREVLAKHHLTQFADFHLGAALGIVDVADCLPTEQVVDYLSSREKAFGNYAPKRFAWKLENVRRFEHPIPMKGMQGLFEVDPYFTQMIRDEMIIWHELHGNGVKECQECHHIAAADKDIVHAKDCPKRQGEAAQ